MWVTSKADLQEALKELSGKVSVIAEILLREVCEYPDELSKVFEQIGKLQSLVDHLEAKNVE
jgi:hypothetical protein